jgi:MFS family permease
VPPESRGQALSVFGGINRMGTFAGPAIGGFLGELVGRQRSFLFAGFMAGAAFLMAFIFVKQPTMPVRHLPTRDRWNVVRTSLRTHRRDLGAAAVAQTLAQMIRAGRQLLMPLYAADRINLNPSDDGLVMTASATVDMLLFLPAGLLMDRVGRKAAMVPSFTIMGIGIALIPFATSFSMLLAAAMIVGIGNGLGAGTMMTLGADLAPPGATGEFLGLWRLIGDVGSVMGPLVVGIMAQAIGLDGSAYALAVVGGLAALTIGFLVRETRKAPVDVTVT